MENTKVTAIFGSQNLAQGDTIHLIVLHENKTMEDGSAPVGKLLNWIEQQGDNFRNISDPLNIMVYTPENLADVQICIVQGNGSMLYGHVPTNKLFSWLRSVGHLQPTRTVARKTA
jgi:hypothetical protein